MNAPDSEPLPPQSKERNETQNSHETAMKHVRKVTETLMKENRLASVEEAVILGED